ncbi:MAG: anthranilate synthase component I [Candidatus Omnitrophota bacterium]
MYTPSLKEFLRLSKTANLIPIFKEISADMDTPVSSFLKLKKDKYAFLLESVEGQEKIARYSFLGSNPSLIFEARGRNIRITDNQKKRITHLKAAEHPLAELRKIILSFKPADIKGLPRFYGGFVGFMGYDAVRLFEKLPDINSDDLKLPDSVFILTDTILAFDHINHKISIICNVILDHKASLTQKKASYKQAVSRISVIENNFYRTRLDYNKRFVNKKKHVGFKNISSNFTKAKFCSIVDKAKDYIRKGDIIQVVLSQRFAIPARKKAFDIYRSLRSLNPSPYMFFLKLNKCTLIGSSPEMLVRVENGTVETRPIAGTRKRGQTEAEDKRLSLELLRDKKERAEHLMLVDLGRNDLGRVCRKATVKVNDFMLVEKYSHVAHLVSDVSGILDKGYDAFSALQACFPAGTVSGAPKIRAMEIIEELENSRRGPYAGSVGYFAFSRNMDTCITIRTIVVKDGIAYIQAGAGIVLDSIPEKEYQESQNKAKALIEAIVS